LPPLEKHSSFSMNFIDLFAGAGGFSLGFSLEGFTGLLAIEKNEETTQTYLKNFPRTDLITRDIQEVHSLEILSKIGSSPTVILASPPCEPFTSANPNRKHDVFSRFFEDPKGNLVFHAIRIIGDMKPQFFVIENVIPMIEGEGKELIKEELKKVGYQKIYFNILSAENLGCPSVRKRVFISNIHLDIPLQRKIVVHEALADLPHPSYPNNMANHEYIHLSNQAKRRIDTLRVGQAAVFFKGATGEKQNWVKLDPNKLAPTVMGKSRFIHPYEERSLTPREHARLMGYPDGFIFRGNTSAIYNQIGESVPPPVSRLIAKKIKEKLQF